MALFNNVRQPPLMVTLQEAPYKPKSKVKLTGKYLLMAVVWYYALKLAMV